MAKVSIIRCPDYETANVFNAVKRAVDLIGGIDTFVKPGMKVLLKPNLLSARVPDDAVDTHPEVVRAVVRLVKGAGAVPCIGDSPGGYGKNIDEVFEKSGIKRMAEEEGVELERFTASRFVNGTPIARQIFDSDRVISIPKLKTHSVTVLTAAIKNMFGAVVGLYKAQCHSRAPKEEDFCRIIAKVYSIARPHLTIVDGIIAMEGDGPSSGAIRKMNLIMAGMDAVAIDSCLAKIMGVKPLDILVTKEAYEAKLGEADMSKIEVMGDDLDTFIAKDFKLPQTTPLKFLPRSVMNGIASLIKFKPYIDIGICRRCNLCKIACPVSCIEIEKNYCRIDYKKCVRCLCCHEVCPYRAISIKRNILTKMVWG
ncbi:MAG: hypothetical protein A3K16_01615 [Omnitrophica bacterium RIFCSPLOWO2_01_FULL_45_24]|nr:MAG: hypothetical protein A3K16_01615 [Omnitrophica bacterium RIFCSPLOWO2_01_FULL_45_24]